MAWTRRKLEAWTADHLADSSPYIEKSHDAWTTHFGNQRAQLEGLRWRGLGGEAAVEHAYREQATSMVAAEIAQAASTTSSAAAGVLTHMKSMITSAIADAEAPGPQGGFIVNDDFSIDDTVNSYPSEAIRQVRQQQADEHSQRIIHHLTHWQMQLRTVAQQLRGHRAALDGVQFADNYPLLGGA